MAEEISPRGSPSPSLSSSSITLEASPSSSSTTLEEQVREELVCNVCLGILREPRMMKCEHSFCLECLERMSATKNNLRANPLGEDELECPCCRGVMKLGPGKVGALPASINLRRLSQLLTEEEKEFTLRRKKAMRNRKSRRQKTFMCDSHPEKVIECYCHECRALLCVKCLDEGHRNHEWGHVEAAVEKHVADLKSSVQPGTEVICKADEMMTEILGRKEELMTSCTKTTDAVHRFFDKAKKIISAREEKLDRTARRYTDVKVSHLDVHYKKLTESKAAASDTIEKIRRVIKEYEILGSNQCLQILSSSQTMVERLHKCREEIANTSKTMATSAGLETCLTFQHDEHLSHQLNSMGHLYERTKAGSSAGSIRQIIVSREEDDGGYTSVPIRSRSTRARPGEARTGEKMPLTSQEGPPQAPPHVPQLCVNGEVYDTLLPASNQQKKAQHTPQTGRPTDSSHPVEGRRSSAHETVPPPLPSAELDNTYIDHEEANPPPPPPQRQESVDSQAYEVIPDQLLTQQLTQPGSVVQRRHSSPREYSHSSNRDYCVVVTDDDTVLPDLKPQRRNAMTPSMLPRRQGIPSHHQPRQRHMSEGEEDPLYELLPLQGTLQPVMIWDNSQLLSSQAQHGTVHPRGVCCMNGTDNIIIADIKSHCLRLVEYNGTLLTTIGSEGKASGQFKEPIAVAVDSDNNIYTTELENPRVQKFMPNGKYITRFGQKRVGSPEGIAVSGDRDGCIYVSDKEKGKIFVYQPNGKHHFTIGKASQFLRHPVGITFDRRGRLLVADKEENCIWILTPAGEILSRVGSEGSLPGQLLHPHGVAAMQDGRIVVVECGNNRVSVFSVNGQFQSAFGNFGSGSGQFNHPKNVCVNSKNQIIVTDEMNHRLQIFELT